MGSRKHLLNAIDGSLTRLGTDYVDLYQLHIDDPDTPLDETVEALDTVARLTKAAAAIGELVAAVSIAWVLANPASTPTPFPS